MKNSKKEGFYQNNYYIDNSSNLNFDKSRLQNRIKTRNDKIKDLQDQVKFINQYNKILSKIIR